MINIISCCLFIYIMLLFRTARFCDLRVKSSILSVDAISVRFFNFDFGVPRSAAGRNDNFSRASVRGDSRNGGFGKFGGSRGGVGFVIFKMHKMKL